MGGAGIGFISGVTGVGGGIFLAPLVLTFGWADTRQAAAVSAIFNLLNSAAALAGAWATLPSLPGALPWWLLAVGVGGFLGSWVGMR
ncbi:TSUP family transporter, partial [Salmonella enterica]|uniref:TSUP family transporter n=1 Tax=Salmonella enterica TaxID=28901 RepID=UPI003CF8E188